MAAFFHGPYNPGTGAMMARAIVYIDGFNFFYGSVRGTAYKWLNLEACFRRLRQADDLQRIYYFTAIVNGAGQRRQQVCLRALATLPLVQVVLGKFKTKQITCRVPGCTFRGPRRFDAPEEKRTDVNIALQLLDDGLHDRADSFVLVSGDSDLVPALRLLKSYVPGKKLIVYVPSRDPTRGAATELRNAADKNRTFPQELLKVSQFPARVADGHGGYIEKPADW